MARADVVMRVASLTFGCLEKEIPEQISLMFVVDGIVVPEPPHVSPETARIMSNKWRTWSS